MFYNKFVNFCVLKKSAFDVIMITPKTQNKKMHFRNNHKTFEYSLYFYCI